MEKLHVLTLISVLKIVNSGVIEKEIVTVQTGTFSLLSEHGLSTLGRSSLIFKVMSCKGAVMAFTDIVSISRNKGRYFLLFLGKQKGKKMNVMIRDSCFKCDKMVSVEKSVLECDTYKPFWVAWDTNSTLRVGEGLKLGQNPLIEYTASNKFSIQFTQVTSLRPPAKYKFLVQEEIVFSAPQPDGSSKVTIKEDVAIGTVVYQIQVTPEVDLIMQSESSHFKLSGNELRTTKLLDYEIDRFYILSFRTKELHVNVTLTILVEDVNDETPEVVLGEGIKIPEELPVGFIIGGVFTAKDKDANDSLTFSLEGKDSSYFTVIGMGQLRLEKHIDYDGPSAIKKLDVTLHVVDTANHDSAHLLTIVITDINDNVPTCTSGLFTKTIKPDAESDKPIMNIPCSDEDSGRNGQFSLRIVPNRDEKEHTKKFWLAGVDLFADIKKLREEASKKESATYILKLLAVDTPKSGRANTGTAVVIINLPHRKPRRPNDHKPKWVSTSPDQHGNFPDQTVAEDAPPGTIINRYYAEDLDPGSTVAYMINSISDDKGDNDTGPFIIDFKNGNLRTTGILDCDPGTGGVKYYELSLMATDGENVISGFVRVIIKNSNDNPPLFNKMIYTYDARTFKNFAKPILTLNVDDIDDGSQITLSLAKNALQYFRITPTSDAWHLKFRPGIDPREDTTIPPAITVTANDNALEPKTSSAVVILKNLPCLPPTSAPTTANNLTARPTGTHFGTGTRSGIQPTGAGTGTSQGGSVSNIGIGISSSGKTVPLSAEDYEEGSQGQHDVSNIPESTQNDFVCDPVASPDSSRMGLYLKVACAVEGLIIVMTTLLVLAKRCGCLKKSSTAQGNPGRKEPLGCENALRSQDTQSRQSLKKKDGRSNPKAGRSSVTPTPTPSRLDVVNEVPEPDDDEAQISFKAFDASSTSAVIIDDEMTLTAKNKFLNLKKKAEPAPPKQLYSSSSGVTLNDNEMVSVARSKFLEKLKDPTPVAENEPEMVFIARDRFKTLLAKEEGEPSVEMMKHLESSGSGMLAIAKDKFKGLTQTCGNPELDVEKDTPPLNMVSLLDGSCFTAGDDSTVSLAKGKFMDMLKGNKTIGSYMTGNDAILEYASGYNPSNDTVYIAKDKFFDLIKKPDKESGVEETLAVGKEDLMDLVKRDCDPWADPTAKVMEYVCGIDSENGVMFISKQKFLSLANRPGSANTEAMVTMSKPKLAELLQKRSEDAKSNETLNQYVTAISPVTGTVFLTKQRFLSLTQPADESSSTDEVLEVDSTSLEALAKGRDVDKININPHKLGESTAKRTIYIAKSKFLQLTNKGVGNDDEGILEVSKETIDHMSESAAGDFKVTPIATNQTSGSVLITKKTFLKLASHEYEDQDVVMLSKEKAGEMIDEEDEEEDFLKENALAVMPSSGQVFFAKDKFMNMMKEKRTQNDEIDDGSDDELVSVPKEQLTDLLKGGEQRCKSFIRTHAEAFNAATGAVFIARKKFLNVAGKMKVGKEDDEVVSVPKEDLLEMVSSQEDGQNLDKHALALSEDGSKAFIAKSKFMALARKKGEDKGKGEESEMIAVTEESLSEMIGDDKGKSGEILKKYAKAFNPEKKVAYLAKDKFLKLAKNMAASKGTDGEDEEEMIALPKEKLIELTGDKSDSDDKSSVMKHALAFNDAKGTAYLAKSRFMKLIEKSKPVSKDGQNDGECEMVTVPQDQLERLISAGNETTASNTDYLKKVATAINPITKMVYLSRNKFSEIARKSVNSAENINNDNDIVGVQECQLSAMLNEEKGGENMLKKHALAFNKTSGQVYFLKRKFQELASRIPKNKKTSDQESMICESIISSPDTSTAAKAAENYQTASGGGAGTTVQIHIENSPNDTNPRSSSDSDYAQAYPPRILNSDLNNMLIRDGMNGTSSSSGDNGMDHFGYNDFRNEATDSDESDDSSDESGDSILDDESGNPRVVLTITDDPYNEEDREALERKKLRTPHTNTLGKLQSRERKKKKKVKAWDPEVRNRLYATPSGKGKGGAKTKKKGKSKSKVSPENELSDVGGKKKSKRKKSRVVHPEPETVTSETDESYLGVQQHSKKGKRRR